MVSRESPALVVYFSITGSHLLSEECNISCLFLFLPHAAHILNWLQLCKNDPIHKVMIFYFLLPTLKKN